MTTPPWHLLLVDDDPCLLVACARMLRLERPAWTVATAADGAGALAALQARPADLVAADLMLPGMDGLALLEALRRDPATAALPVIITAAHDDRASQREAMCAGADDYLAKPFTVTELIEAVEARLARRNQMAGRTGTAPTALARLRQLLSARELEVLFLVGRGLATKEIAAHLGLSPWTVRVHRSRLMKKLDQHNASALAALAAQAQLPGAAGGPERLGPRQDRSGLAARSVI